MKYLVLNFAIIITFHVGFCQSTSDSYFDYIKNAEKCFFEKNYSNTLSYYQKAFNEYNTPRGNDYYNAALVSFFLNDENIAYAYLKEAVKRGYTMDFISNPIVLKLIKDKDNWGIFENCYDSLHNIYESRLKNPVIDELNNMLREEQQLTDKIYIGEVSQLQLDCLYLKNMQRIISLFEKDSLPQVESFDMKSRQFQSILPYIILRHYFGMVNRALYYPEENKGDFYKQVLKNNNGIEDKVLMLIREGKVSPVLISESQNYNNPNEPFGKLGKNHCRYVYYNNEYIMVEYFNVRKEYTEDELNIINENRRKWFFPEFNEALKLTTDSKQLTDSIHSHLNKYFKYTGQLLANEYFLKKLDSLEFIEYSKDFSDKGFTLEWVYLGIKDGWKLPKEYLNKK